jgi:hypothetical protein
MSAWPLRRAALNRSRPRAITAPTPSGVRGSMNSLRQGANLTRSRPFYTKSLAWTPSHASDNLHRACLSRAKPVRRKAIDSRREHRPAADQPRGRAPTPPARVPEPDNNRRANGGANADADAPPLFRRASQNLVAAAMLLRGCPEPATSEERRVRQQLKALLEAAAAQQAESSASRQRSKSGRAGAPSAHGSNPPPSQQ